MRARELTSSLLSFLSVLSVFLENNIEIIDLPGFGLVWGSSRLFLFTVETNLKIALALVIYFEAEYADSEIKEL